MHHSSSTKLRLRLFCKKSNKALMCEKHLFWKHIGILKVYKSMTFDRLHSQLAFRILSCLLAALLPLPRTLGRGSWVETTHRWTTE